MLANIAAVPLPDADPVHGREGPLREIWGELESAGPHEQDV